ACDICRKRKTKCFGGVPCNYCLNSKLECTFHAHQNKRKRKRRTVIKHGANPNISILEKRLTSMELLIEKLVKQ
ncbi:Zn(II)2Cys6 transcription factor domain-containing protein ASCRUDRAFT_24064, partial [Ascoidea rubescens DSM 1968]